MNIIIKTKNLESTDSLQNLIDKKFSNIQKFLKISKEDPIEMIVEIERETKHKKGDVFKAEAMIYLPGRNLVAQAHGENVIKAMTEVKKQLEREIRKYKTKIVELPRRKSKKLGKENL